MKGGAAPGNTVDTKIVDAGIVKVGFYGLTTEETPLVASPGPDVTFLPSVETALAKSKELKAAGADIVVAVVHEPMDIDLELTRNGAADLILSGHDEFLLSYYNGKAAVTESYSQGDYSVITDLTVNKETKDGKTTVTWSPAFRIVDSATVTPDPEIAAVVKGYTDKLAAELKIEIGTTETPLDSRRATVRGQEAAIGNLIADSIRAAVGADVGITNGGGIRADKEYPAGTKLTRGDILAELPFGNKTVKLELSGKDLRAAVENGLSQVEKVAGRFPQVSGIAVVADLNKAPGARIVSISVGGAPLDEGKTYIVATNDFMANGGDGYAAFRNGKQLIDAVDATLMASQVIDYVAAHKTVAPKVEGRIVTQ